MTPDIQDALKALNRQFGKDLYLAKSDTCMAAFKALKEATTTEQELSALGKYVREWIDRSAAAVRFWTPKYAAMADAFLCVRGDMPRHFARDVRGLYTPLWAAVCPVPIRARSRALGGDHEA